MLPACPVAVDKIAEASCFLHEASPTALSNVSGHPVGFRPLCPWADEVWSTQAAVAKLWPHAGPLFGHLDSRSGSPSRFAALGPSQLIVVRAGCLPGMVVPRALAVIHLAMIAPELPGVIESSLKPVTIPMAAFALAQPAAEGQLS